MRERRQAGHIHAGHNRSFRDLARPPFRCRGARGGFPGSACTLAHEAKETPLSDEPHWHREASRDSVARYLRGRRSPNQPASLYCGAARRKPPTPPRSVLQYSCSRAVTFIVSPKMRKLTLGITAFADDNGSGVQSGTETRNHAEVALIDPSTRLSDRCRCGSRSDSQVVATTFSSGSPRTKRSMFRATSRERRSMVPSVRGEQ